VTTPLARVMDIAIAAGAALLFGAGFASLL
jgi:hypothetical protein